VQFATGKSGGFPAAVFFARLKTIEIAGLFEFQNVALILWHF
jgi:hypothetical protein